MLTSWHLSVQTADKKHLSVFYSGLSSLYSSFLGPAYLTHVLCCLWSSLCPLMTNWRTRLCRDDILLFSVHHGALWWPLVSSDVTHLCIFSLRLFSVCDSWSVRVWTCQHGLTLWVTSHQQYDYSDTFTVSIPALLCVTSVSYSLVCGFMMERFLVSVTWSVELVVCIVTMMWTFKPATLRVSVETTLL